MSGLLTRLKLNTPKLIYVATKCVIVMICSVGTETLSISCFVPATKIYSL